MTSPAPETPKRQSYHHGDARNALIAAAGQLIEDVGAAGLSLRQVAEKAGLSRQAPYNHFADKEALLAELARDGFAQLERAMRDASAIAVSGSGLARVGEAYIAFAQGTPARFRLMFSRELVDIARFPDASAAGDRAFSVLVTEIAGFAPAGQVRDLSLMAWSAAHGYATLCVEVGLEAADMREARAALIARLIHAAIEPEAATRVE